VNEPIKVGDRVKCIDDTASFNKLRVGNEYTVEAAYDGTPVVIVANAYHSIDRFELVKGRAELEREVFNIVHRGGLG
jgi:hypothetical protein